MKTEDFQIGDTVRLKSGGPLMTIALFGRAESGLPTAHTVWFDKDDKEVTGNFPVAALTADNRPPQVPSRTR